MVDYQLAQLIKEPTRVNAKSQTLIDVFITNKEDNISHSGVYTLFISDHNLYCEKNWFTQGTTKVYSREEI